MDLIGCFSRHQTRYIFDLLPFCLTFGSELDWLTPRAVSSFSLAEVVNSMFTCEPDIPLFARYPPMWARHLSMTPHELVPEDIPKLLTLQSDSIHVGHGKICEKEHYSDLPQHISQLSIMP